MNRKSRSLNTKIKKSKNYVKERTRSKRKRIRKSRLHDNVKREEIKKIQKRRKRIEKSEK